ncbi:MAG: hypothetical protein A3J58_03325 [Candidatus Sungbacteria bacterium RIFCSPHIGHO2_02_FULL_52_23]|uniref:Uncharacterized protein n=1 Tax=Candidatus Sungbacteria bacterium RIFCSPHIGHO2_02_FULL_52_23 TaxID=1802274 RepID=A0A1G2L0M6_9BACT|nr:MAG: hypothetical protein A3J58_03325 [Candidatus Sungbacteria bacterium RIFCSPHIGHO2_02_FULL_52_23]
MFIISFLWAVMELAVVAVGGFYLWIDYRRGFPSLKHFIDRATDFGMKIFRMERDEVKRADLIVARFAAHLGTLREAVASIQTRCELDTQHGHEQEKLARDFRALAETALRAGDEDAAAAAVTAAVEADKRSRLLFESADTQAKVGEELQRELDREEMRYETVQTQAETVAVNQAVAAAKMQLYELVSDVAATTGMTPKGELKHLLETSTHQRIKAGKLLDMAHRRNGSTDDVLYQAEVLQELDAIRGRMALPEGKAVNGVIGDAT